MIIFSSFKTVEEIKKALEIPPEIRFSNVSTFNAFVNADIQLHDERTNGWFWAGQDNAGFIFLQISTL
jgi:hypothetical protein